MATTYCYPNSQLSQCATDFSSWYATSIYNVASAALYGGLASTAIFYLSTATGLPTTISATAINTFMRITTTSVRAYLKTQPPEQEPPSVITIVGEEVFTGLGASLLYGNLVGQLAGATGGLILWHGLTWWY